MANEEVCFVHEGASFLLVNLLSVYLDPKGLVHFVNVDCVIDEVHDQSLD